MDSLQTHKILDLSNELTITVIGRKTGRQYSTPVWFVREEKTVFLLPGGGSQSSWYKNAVKSKRIRISSGKLSLDLTAKSITESARLASVVEKFRKKYGATYYSDPKRFNVGLELTLQ